MRRILFTETDFNTLPNPPSGFKYIGFNGPNFSEKDEAGNTTTTGGGGGISDVTYSELHSKISLGQLTPGAYYKITDFKTCYDQPDYDESGNAVIVGNYKQGSVDPIIVFATSEQALSVDAHQPSFSNDTIKYDFSWTQSEITGGTAYGRITERVDEYGNRTDYDHREIRFKRYTTYFVEEPITGTFQVTSSSGTTASVLGTDTFFDALSTDLIIHLRPETGSPESGKNYKIVSIISDTEMVVEGKTIFSDSNLKGFYTSTSYDDDGSDSWKSYEHRHNNIIGTEYREIKTFRYDEEILQEGSAKSINNYIGNYSNFYNTSISHSPFLLANNVFGKYSYSNVIGVKSYDNSTGTWFARNRIEKEFIGNNILASFYENNIGRYFRSNRISSSFNANEIGNEFNNNLIYNSFYQNTIGHNFYTNIVFNQFYSNDVKESATYNLIFSQFYGNSIKKSFYSNRIFSDFYENQIGIEFRNNTISDYGNKNNFNFHRNVIGNNYEYNYVDNDFQNNHVGNQFNNNNIRGSFYKNRIGNGFNGNDHISRDFNSNQIGNGFNNNYYIGEYFESNVIGDYFNNNRIAGNFKNNNVGNDFEDNYHGDYTLYSWNNLSGLADRTYTPWRAALNNQVGYYIVGEDLIMKDTANNEYYKVKFTQWTQGNGGGFAYERTKVDPITGNNIDSTVVFAKADNVVGVDIIVPGVLEITRGNNGGIYNRVEEGSYNQSTSPYGTEWNSRFVSINSGDTIENNRIANVFKSNIIIGRMSKNEIGPNFNANHVNAEFISNHISSDFVVNNLNGSFSFNEVGYNFYNNTLGSFLYNNIGSDFTSNNAEDNFMYNTIGSGFSENIIGMDFGYGGSSTKGNNIGNSFYSNVVGEYFYDNRVCDLFIGNTMSDWFQRNDVKTPINDVDFTAYSGNILSFSYSFGGELPDTYDGQPVVGATFYNVSGTYSYGGSTASVVVDATFDIYVAAAGLLEVTLNNPGKYYLPAVGFTASTITIAESKFANGYQYLEDSLIITIDQVSDLPSVYAEHNTEIFKRAGGVNRLSYYDASDVLTITDIDK